MKKRTIASILAASMLAVPSAFAAESGDKVEISFKVGDSTLTVNGEPLTVNAPYVVGEGTTLVPIRVITEAFGAQIDWDGETQSVSLKYPDVDITIRIGSRSASVNTHTEELAAAPELNNDTTMVPLRFISETFGAKVDYDDDTRLITVTKEAAADTEDESKLRGATDKDYIGDSYYNWTIRNPKTLSMESRSFDGRRTRFSDENSKLAIYVDSEEEPYDVDTEFNRAKELLSGDTITIADKSTGSDGTTTIHMRSKNKSGVYDIICLINGKEERTILTSVNADADASVQNDIFSMADSFSWTTSGRDYYDLSNVQGKMREFKDDTLKISLMLPADWAQSESDSSNQFAFADSAKPHNYVDLGVYSKDSSTSAKSLADKDRSSWNDIVNKSLATVSEVTPTTINGMSAYKYTIEYNGDGKNKYIFSDNFIELGDYVYNLCYSGESFTDSTSVISTLKLEKLDKEEVGIMLRSSDLSSSHKVDVIYGTVTAGALWTSLGSTSNILLDQRTSGIITVTRDSDPSKSKVVELFPEIIRQITADENTISMGASATKSIGSKLYYYSTVKTEKDDTTFYTTIYMVKANSYLYSFMYTRPDIYYGGAADKEAEEIIFSFEPSSK